LWTITRILIRLRPKSASGVGWKISGFRLETNAHGSYNPGGSPAIDAINPNDAIPATQKQWAANCPPAGCEGPSNRRGMRGLEGWDRTKSGQSCRFLILIRFIAEIGSIL
jgi:hypothetical protein